MKVILFFAVYKRLKILEIFLDGLERLISENPDIEWIPFAVYSEADEGEILKRHGIRSLQFDNEYLGRKKNAGLRELLKLDFDYIMELGSDDLVNSKLIELYKPYWEQKVDAFGIGSCYFIETSTGRVAYWNNDYAIGAGRCIRKEIFKNLGKRWRVRYNSSTVYNGDGMGKGKEVVYVQPIAERLVDSGLCTKVRDENDTFGLWGDKKNIALDGDSQHRLGMNGYNVKMVYDGYEPMIIDLKSDENMHSFETFTECDIGIEQLLADFSKKERDGIWQLR